MSCHFVERCQDRLSGPYAQRVGEEGRSGQGKRAGLPSDVADRMKEPERESRELRRANEILREASAYIAQAELGRPLKPCSLSSMNIERACGRADLQTAADCPVHLL